MLLFIALLNFVCLLLPALGFARVTTSEHSVNLAAHHVKRLSTPLKNLLHKRDAILFAGTPNVPNGLALNSTNGEVAETVPFEAEIDIDGLGSLIYFSVKGEIDEDYSVTVEVWVHYIVDKPIGVFHGDLAQGIDMKVPDNIKVINGEARLYMVSTGGYNLLFFDARGSVQIPSKPTAPIGHLIQVIKRWKIGDLKSIQDVPNNSVAQTLSSSRRLG